MNRGTKEYVRNMRGKLVKEMREFLFRAQGVATHKTPWTPLFFLGIVKRKMGLALLAHSLIALSLSLSP